MKTKESVYVLTLEVFGYYDHSFRETRNYKFKDGSKLLKILKLLEPYKGTTYNFKDGYDEISELLDNHDATEITIPYFLEDAVKLKTVIYEEVNFSKLEKIAKIKKIKERSKLCTE